MISSGRRMRRAAAVLCFAILAPGAALGDEPTPPEAPQAAAPGGDALAQEPARNAFEEVAAKAFDVFPIRVLSSCATVLGFGAFLVSVPLVAPAGRMEAIRDSWEYFVLGPVDYTFVRPLGDL